MTINRLLSTREVAQLLGRSPRRIRHFIKRGDLMAVNVGLGRHRPRYIVTAEALATFLARRATSGPDVSA